MPIRLLPIMLLFVLVGCGGGGGGSTPTGSGGSSSGGSGGGSNPLPPPAKPFTDATAASNIRFVRGLTLPSLPTTLDRWVRESTFGGVAAGDCDLDGDIDLFITYGDAGTPAGSPNQLYLNQFVESGNGLLFNDIATGELAYTRDSVSANYRHSGPTFADMDGDGDPDLFIGGLYGEPNLIFENVGLGTCTFINVTDNSPDISGIVTDQTISAGFGDYDLDGDLDMFLTHWGSFDEFGAGGESEHLFRNVSDSGGIRFENVSAETDVTAHLISGRAFYENNTGPALDDATYTATFARINDDLWPDLALASDFGTAQLLINDLEGSGTFLERTNDAIHSIEYGMGSALGDIDWDGDLDWFVTSIHARNQVIGLPHTGNRLLRNSGVDFDTLGFENITDAAGIADGGGYAWGACFLDIDNDTDLDIYHTNGFDDNIAGQDFNVQESVVFRASGDGTTYTNWSAAAGLDDLNKGRGVVCADFDQDGDIDIFQQTDNGSNSGTLWENASAAAGRNFLRVKLVGLPPNTEAAGARIHATAAGRTQMREIMIGSNYTSQNPTEQVFGLGSSTSIDTLQVEWPGLSPGSGQPPVQPADWIKANVAAGSAGQTLIICHPDINPQPAGCTAPD